MSKAYRKQSLHRKLKREGRQDLADIDNTNEAENFTDDFDDFDDFIEEDVQNNPQAKAARGRKPSLFKAIQGISENISKVGSQIGSDVAGEMGKLGQKVARSAQEIRQEASKSATELGQGMAKRTKEVAQSAVELSQGVAKSATELGEEVTKSAKEKGKAVQQEARQFISKNLEKSQDTVGKKLEENQAAKEASVRAYIKQINLSEMEDAVNAMWDKFPSSKPEEISQRLLRQQILRVSKTSAVFSVVPPKMADSIGVNYVSVALMQAEIIFKIAAVYDFDIWLPQRKPEAFAIIDRVLRASRQAMITLSVSQMIPLAGGVVNVGTDAYLIYRIGDTAKEFYESLTEEVTPGEILKAFIAETESRYTQRLW